MIKLCSNPSVNKLNLSQQLLLSEYITSHLEL